MEGSAPLLRPVGLDQLRRPGWADRHSARGVGRAPALDDPARVFRRLELQHAPARTRGPSAGHLRGLENARAARRDHGRRALCPSGGPAGVAGGGALCQLWASPRGADPFRHRATGRAGHHPRGLGSHGTSSSRRPPRLATRRGGFCRDLFFSSPLPLDRPRSRRARGGETPRGTARTGRHPGDPASARPVAHPRPRTPRLVRAGGAGRLGMRMGQFACVARLFLQQGCGGHLRRRLCCAAICGRPRGQPGRVAFLGCDEGWPRPGRDLARAASQSTSLCRLLRRMEQPGAAQSLDHGRARCLPHLMGHLCAQLSFHPRRRAFCRSAGQEPAGAVDLRHHHSRGDRGDR